MKLNFGGPLLVAFLLLPVLAACKKKEAPPPPASNTPSAVPFRVASIDLGKSLGADKRIAQPAAAFGSRDTIYASVVSEGATSGTTISARWTFEDGQVINEMTESVTTSGPAATEFHITKASPWPAGRYAVEVSVNGVASGKKDFTVSN